MSAAAAAASGSASSSTAASSSSSHSLPHPAPSSDAAKRRFHPNIHAGQEVLADDSFHSYYCAFCGTLAFILDTILEELPRRNSDQARVVTLQKHQVQVVCKE